MSPFVDDEDYFEINGYNWCIFDPPGKRSKYAMRRIILVSGRSTTIKMHKQLLPGNHIVDHIDGNGLNNCKSNLRVATNSQNRCNSFTSVKSKCGYIGVMRECQKYRARIGGGNKIDLGLYNTAEEAAKARDIGAKEKYGDFARLNFEEC